VAASHGVQALVHVSAIGADRIAKSSYARTKGEGESRVLAEYPDAVIVRPSIVFGPEDRFFNRFASLSLFAPVLPVVGSNTRFQPVYAGDVAQAIVAALSGRARGGAAYELGGPGIYTLQELLKKIGEWTEHRRPLLPIPFFFAKPVAFFMQFMPGAPITLDQIRLLERDNVVGTDALGDNRTLPGLGVDEPRSVELIVPWYLQRFRPNGEFSTGSIAVS
jgi:NADH dehydrogenase